MANQKIIGNNTFDTNLGAKTVVPNVGTTIFSIGQTFNVTTNASNRVIKDYDSLLTTFSKPITLDDLKLSSITATTQILANNTQIFLNLNKKDISNYALFGSLQEYIRVTLEQIIQKYPASLYINNIISADTKISILNYSYDSSSNLTIFDVPVLCIINNFGINYSQNSTLFASTSNLKDFSVNYQNYAILPDVTSSVEYPISAFTGSSAVTGGYVRLQVIGNPFPSASGGTLSTRYHIKPKFNIVEDFFNSLENFESYILNRDISPKFTATFTVPVETDDGVYVLLDKNYTWPTTDGYNIDINGAYYRLYLEELMTLGANNDDYKTNLISRFFTTDAIKEFDTVDRKADKLLKIYGREFDEIKTFIDGIAYANRVTYNKIENVSDNLVKNLAKVLGWGVLNSVSEDDLLTTFLGSASQIRFSGTTKSLTPVEADIELWRRIILNTSWLFKSKGTRKAIEFIFKFIGAPDCLIDINEHVYTVDNTLDPTQVELALYNKNIPPPIPAVAETLASGQFSIDNTPFNLTTSQVNISSLQNNPNVSVGTIDNNLTNFNALISVGGNVIATIPSTNIIASNLDNANLQARTLIVNALNNSIKYSAFTSANTIYIKALVGTGSNGNGVLTVDTNATASNIIDLIGGADFIPQIILSGTAINMDTVAIDSDGFPKILPETTDYYFQLSGGWRSEVVISPMNDKNTESPVGVHLGPFDAGQSYYTPFTDIGFKIHKTVDNKKSWITSTATTVLSSSGNNTNYSVNDTRLILNSKEVSLTLDFAKAIECDVKNYISIADCPINVSGLTYPYPNTSRTRQNVDNMSFAQFIDFAYTNFINAQNRKVISDENGGGYPTLKKLYMDYYYRSKANCGVTSSMLNFDKVIGYVEKLDSFWVKLIDQLVPATIIWEGGEKYRNTVFNRQKFVYKHGINDSSEFQTSGITLNVGTICVSPCNSGNIVAPNQPAKPGTTGSTTTTNYGAVGGVNGIISEYMTFNKINANTYPSININSTYHTVSNYTLASMPLVHVPISHYSPTNLIISSTSQYNLLTNPSNTYNLRNQYSGPVNLKTGRLIDETYAFCSNDILRVREDLCQTIFQFTQPDFSISGASKILTGLTSDTVHNIADGDKSVTFIFTANTESLTASTTIFKYEVFPYVNITSGETSQYVSASTSSSSGFTGFTGFATTILVDKEVPNYVWTAQTATTKTYTDTIAGLSEGEYLIKGSFLISGGTTSTCYGGSATLLSAVTFDTLDLTNAGSYPYNIYDASLDWYFIMLASADKPIIDTNFITSGNSGSSCTGLTLVSEVIPIIIESQTGFTTSFKSVGDVMINVNGNTLLPADNITFINSDLSLGEVFIDDITDPNVDLIYLREPLLISQGDVLSAVYLKGSCNQGVTTEGLTITGITTGTTASSSNKVFYNSGTSRYEYYLNQPINQSNIVFILNGNKLNSGTDYVASTTNLYRIILFGNLSVGDTIFVYYLNQGLFSNNTVLNANFNVGWDISPPTNTNNGQFTIQIAYDTDINFSNIQFSGVTGYEYLSGSTGGTTSVLINPNTQKYNKTIVLNQANKNFGMRIKSERYYTSISGQTFTSLTYSDTTFFKTDNSLHAY